MSPQASKQQREDWGGEQGVGSEKAIEFLESRGFKLTRDYDWLMPSPKYQLTGTEISAAQFLVDEWDYGWFVAEYKPKVVNSSNNGGFSLKLDY